ncbi:transposase [Streptomyces sp. NPDC058398]|uniref:transposase n=1 Tax=Streptomyces sp. NPDC058398 TaxID=3346479 RepID=UPI00364E96EE
MEAWACGLRTRYSTDLSDLEWEILRSLVPAVRPGGWPAKHTRREILKALANWLRAGCAWRLLPHDLPPWQTVYHYWRRWQQEGVWERMLTALRERERVQLGRDPTPSAAIVDSQSVQASERGGLHGYNASKKVSGIKRYLGLAPWSQHRSPSTRWWRPSQRQVNPQAQDSSHHNPNTKSTPALHLHDDVPSSTTSQGNP